MLESLTHRLYSSSFAVVPGYEDPSKKESAIDWSRLATGVGTLVFLMAVKNVDQIAQKLIDNGRSPGTPVAVIRWGTRPDQTTVVGTLSTIGDLLKERDIKPPAVMVVGEVVKLRESLNWYETVIRTVVVPSPTAKYPHVAAHSPSRSNQRA
jgi:uroporphyrinogen III methyltransferase/synthase